MSSPTDDKFLIPPAIFKKQIESMKDKYLALGQDMPQKYKVIVMHPHKVLKEEEKKEEEKEEEKKEEKEEESESDIEEKKLSKEEKKKETKKYGYAAKQKLIKAARKEEKYLR